MATTLQIAGGETNITRLLRRQHTDEYFKDDGWTNNPSEAKCFLDVIEVAEVCARWGLDDVEVTLRLHSQACDFFCMPMR